MKISVIIPVHNEEEYIGECLKSLEKQTFRDFEIICVDDDSTDNSLNIIKQHAEQDSRIRIISIFKSGAAVARNVGIESAAGQYLSILDADDIYEPEMLEKMYRQIVREGSDVCMCGSAYVDTQSGEHGPIETLLSAGFPLESPFEPSKISDNIFLFCAGWPWDKLFSREFINRNGLRFQSLPNSNDAYFVYMSLVLAKKISYTSDVLVFHRTNKAESVSSPKSRSEHWMSMYYAMDAIFIGLVNRNKFEHYEKGFIRWTASFSRWYITTIEQPYKDEAIKYMKNTLIPKLILGNYSMDYFNDLSDYYWIKALVAMPVGEYVNYGDILSSFYSLISSLGEEIKQKDITISNLTYAIDYFGIKLGAAKQLRISASYRIGRAITWTPRMISGAFRGLKNYGLWYVIVRTFGGRRAATKLRAKIDKKRALLRAKKENNKLQTEELEDRIHKRA